MENRKQFSQQLECPSRCVQELDTRLCNFFRFQEESQENRHLVLWGKAKCCRENLCRKSILRSCNDVWILNSSKMVAYYFIWPSTVKHNRTLI
ncbi:unnamed protein product [Moneuplotes crassus]|uniref:Uncharacterized protein n=1 Tax=Euplotes crassus TaxID=5936 RepID=A0AAD1U076_EUPCR|nr:unnamed protein product [Moneuplotes crassus]